MWMLPRKKQVPFIKKTRKIWIKNRILGQNSHYFWISKVKLHNRNHVLAELDCMLWEQLVWPPFHAANWPSTIWRENLCTLSLFHWRVEKVQGLNFSNMICYYLQLSNKLFFSKQNQDLLFDLMNFLQRLDWKSGIHKIENMMCWAAQTFELVS